MDSEALQFRKDFLESINELSDAIDQHSQTTFSVDPIETYSPQMADALDKHGENIESAADTLEKALSQHGKDIKTASSTFGKDINSAADTILSAVVTGIGGLIGAAFIHGTMQITQKLFELLIDKVRERAQLTQLLNSLDSLTKQSDRISYDRAAKMSFAERTTTEDRITLLNNLIHEYEAVSLTAVDGEDYINIDSNSEGYKKFWGKNDEIAKALENIKKDVNKG